jgi:hypothetical protein
MKHHRSIRRSATWGIALALVALAAAATAAFAGTDSHSSSTPPSKQIAVLRRQAATLRRQNASLRAFTPAGIARELAATKAALDKYQSVDVAKADGYAAASPCESTPTVAEQTSFGGGMGFHYVNQALMKPGPIVPSKPPVLVYAPTAGGGLELVAAEYFKPDADQSVKTDDDRPSLFGRAFDGPMLGHAPGMPIHYDLHVWLWKHNPTGLFSPWNPDVFCP